MHRHLPGLFLAAALVAGCGANPQATHEGDLIDNKVTAQRVEAALRKAGKEYRHVHAEARREGITLKGTVRTEAERSRAEDIARSTGRDMNLTDELRIAK